MRLQFLLLAASIIPLALPAQAPPELKPQQTVQVADGGTSGRMESIFIPPITAAPFSLVLVTEWTRPLLNNGTFTLTNQRRIARDSKGRIYQERWILVPKGGKIKSEMDVVQYTDPAQHTLYNCFTRPKVCELLPYGDTAEMVYKPAIGVTRALPNGNGFHQHEDLGTSSTAGADTIGYRETTTINPGVFGNDLPMLSTREFWYSSHLGINLLSTVDDPSTGKQVFTATELTTSEPEPSLFALPEGFRVIDQSRGK